VIIRFTRRMASAGGLYTYTARGLDSNSGFIGGWLYAWGFAAGISFVLIIASFFLSTVLTVHTSIDLSWFQCFWILVALLTVFALLDIRLSTRTQLLFASLGVLLLVILACVILGKGGAHGVTLQPFNFHHAGTAHDFFYAMVFAFTGFIGFEAAAALGEESAEPRKMIPKAILSAVLVALVFYVFLTWAMSVGFGVDNSAAWAGNPGALDTLATQYVGSWFATLVDIAVVVDAFVAALAGREGARLAVLDRGRHAVAYAKGADAVADVLVAAGASGSVLRLEESAVMAATRGRANRLANADHANLVRVSRAAHAQLQAVDRLRRRGQLERLPAVLQEIADLRTRHPTLSLRELAAKCRPPATKASAHRRLQKLQQLADT